MELNLKQYKGKKVFITGHTGFKGAWLLLALHQIGAQIKGYALAPDNENGGYSVINGGELCESIIADIRNKNLLVEEIVKFAPDYIFHLAAQPLVRESYSNPSYTFDVNVLGTSYLLDAVKKLTNKCSVVIVTTDKVYENKEDGKPFKETDRLGGHDPYSTSKACAEFVVESYNKSFFLIQDNLIINVATARSGNVIGGGDFCKDRIIPDFVRALTLGEVLKIRNPDSVRPWQHVIEPIVGYLMLGLYLNQINVKESLAYNFGPEKDDHLTVKELVDFAINSWGSGSYEVIEEKILHEAGLLKLDITKIKEEIGWSPKLKAKEAIEKTFEWYKAADKVSVMNKQVSNYLGLQV